MDETLTDPDGWRRLHPASRTPSMAGSALVASAAAALAGFFALGFVPSVLTRSALHLLAVVAAGLLGALVGRARWRRTRWKLDHEGFSVRRGWLWHTEVLIPRSRVQHLDLERGPIERQLGLASVVIHTAGTQTPALRQSGLGDADAVALRDALIPASAQHDDAL